MGEGGGGEEKGRPSALSFFRFHLSPFPQKRLILRLKNSRQFSSHALRYASLITCLPNSFLIGQMSRRDQSVRQTTKRGHLC